MSLKVDAYSEIKINDIVLAAIPLKQVSLEKLTELTNTKDMGEYEVAKLAVELIDLDFGNRTDEEKIQSVIDDLPFKHIGEIIKDGLEFNRKMNADIVLLKGGD